MAKKGNNKPVSELEELVDYELRFNKASLYRGKYVDAEFYFNEKGSSSSRDSFDKLEAVEKAKFLYNIKQICDSPLGTKQPKTVSNIEDRKEGIFAVKYSGQGRMASFNCTIIEKGLLRFNKPKLIVSNRYIKKNQSNSKKEVTEIKKAIETKEKYLKRIKIKDEKNNYYKVIKDS